MSRRIHILSDAVANQIAAGEVVERPASVVKELVENALDAGATRIRVEVGGGGKQRIRVSDDGVGMGREDALLSLDRHATSKIADAGDLARIDTFGFRGEALPSIAAISRLTLETREVEDEAGTEIRVEGGRITGVRDAPRQVGTTIEVRNLFFNAPARGKFLKSASAETRAVNEALTKLALANPTVAVSLTSGDRRVLDLPAVKDVATRIGDLWGREAAHTLVSMSGQAEGFGVRGLIQRPDAASPGFRRAYLFVNGRPIKDAALLRAADRGYRTTVAGGQRPWLFLYFQVRDASVDVNVHPAKREVRFRNPGMVQEMVEEAVKQALGDAFSGATLDTQLASPRMEVREHPRRDLSDRRPGRGKRRSPEITESQMALFMAGAPPESTPAGEEEAHAPEENPQGTSAGSPRLWQVHDTYILAETRDGLLLIDQHSAHERVLFQRLMEGFQARGQESSRARRCSFPCPPG